MERVRELWCNGNLDSFFDFIMFVGFIRMPHGDPLLAGFDGFQQAESRLIKSM